MTPIEIAATVIWIAVIALTLCIYTVKFRRRNR